MESSTTLQLGAALLVFLLMIFLECLRACFWRRRRDITPWGLPMYFPHQPRQDEQRNHGLDASVIENLPNFIFKESTQKLDERESIECSVCLEKFKKGEKGRRLPPCGHCFHAECVDMWFVNHATCPLCRAEVTRSLQAVPASHAADSPETNTNGNGPQFSCLSSFSDPMGHSPSGTSGEPSQPYLDLEVGEIGGGLQIGWTTGRQLQEDGRSARHISAA